LDQREGYVAVQRGIVGQVDLLPAALAQEALDGVTAISEGGWLARDCFRCRRGRCRRTVFWIGCRSEPLLASIGCPEKCRGVFVLWIEVQDLVHLFSDQTPFAPRLAGINLVQERVYAALNPFAWHTARSCAERMMVSIGYEISWRPVSLEP
jgi:hypothetical protein